jgi:hypothetical protein
MMHDRIRDRFNIQLGLQWQLMPAKEDSWLQWAFSPSFGVTRMGQKFTPFSGARRFLPEGPSLHTMVDEADDGMGKDPATGLKNWWFVSRIFWVHGALRVLGLDLGFGVYLRKRYEPALAAAAEGGDVKQAPGEASQSGPKGNAQ